MSAEFAPSVFDSAAVVSLRAGDVIVLRFAERLSPAARDHWAGVLDECFPAHESIILENGADVAIVHPPLPKAARAFRSVARGSA